MAASETVKDPATETPNFGRMTVDHLRYWSEICDRFNQWQHEYIIGRNPTSHELHEHRQGLKWLLRLTRLMHYVASDPEFPDQSVVQILETKIWQLEQAWKLLYRKLSRYEIEGAEKLLKTVFPDESGA